MNILFKKIFIKLEICSLKWWSISRWIQLIESLSCCSYSKITHFLSNSFIWCPLTLITIFTLASTLKSPMLMCSTFFMKLNKLSTEQLVGKQVIVAIRFEKRMSYLLEPFLNVIKSLMMEFDWVNVFLTSPMKAT